MLGVAQRRKHPREAAPSAAQAVGGLQGEALAQRAGERRIGAKNLVEQREAGAGG